MTTNLPWLIFGFPLYVYVIAGGFGLLIGVPLGVWLVRRTP
jgi:ABC-type proline/glycine betaine transport system permease subunit